MRQSKQAALILAMTILIPACSTISRGTNDTLVVDTIPAGAKVQTDRVVGKNKDGSPIYAGCLSTPCEIKIPRRSEFLLTLTHAGHEPVEIGVTSSRKSEALRSNLSTTGKVGVAMGATTFGVLASASGLGITTGAAATAGISTAGIVTAIPFVTSMAIDSATGATLNLTPNPIIIQLPPEGSDTPVHAQALAIREKRASQRKAHSPHKKSDAGE